MRIMNDSRMSMKMKAMMIVAKKYRPYPGHKDSGVERLGR